jgi:hypothetical protein
MTGPRSRSVSGHGAMNVYENNGRRPNTCSATDPEISVLPIDSKFLPQNKIDQWKKNHSEVHY